MKIFLRMPVWLYRLHLGWLLGNRFLCIAHRGRKSGKLREPERVELLTCYVRDHPAAARELGRVFGVITLDKEGIAGLTSRTRAIAFKPSSDK